MIFITGTGQLGQELQNVFKDSKKSFQAFSIEEWDICNTKQNEEILSKNPRILINTAAYTAVDKAESEEKLAYEINSEAVLHLAEICRKRNIFLLHISTDFIFGKNPLVKNGNLKLWSTNDISSPIGIYAESKKKGELHIENTLSHGYSIIRTSWLYSAFGNNFPKTILRLLKDPNRKELSVIEDQIGRPTWAYRLAIFIDLLVQNIINSVSIDKVYHFSNSGLASWYDFACAIQEIGLRRDILKDKKSITPIPTESYPTPAERPRFSVMNLSNSQSIMKNIPHWRDDLEIALSQPEFML
jgi:dTDP-4-dehydrorhamnose reductase